MNRDGWVVYLVRCCDGSLYCGVTNDLKNRLAAHNAGKGAKYARSRRPVELIAASTKMTKSAALKLEHRIKRVPARNKESELAKGVGKMTTQLKKELVAVNRQLKALSTKIEKMIVASDKLESNIPAKKTKTKTIRKASAKKKAVPAKSSIKNAVSNKAQNMTAANTVLGFIQRSKNGVNTGTLAAKTGFNKKKIANIIYMLKKIGKIQSPGKGVYVKA